MPTLKIIPKSNARQIQQRQKLKTRPYDKGKYEWLGESHYLGKPVKVTADVVQVFVDQRRDQDGYFAKIMCLLKREDDQS